MRVERATTSDLDAARAAYAHGRALQRAQGSTVWPEFTDAQILAEIEAGRMLRVLDGDELAGVFSVAYEDAAIWGELERGAHIYLHRIARTATFRGRGLIDAVLAWGDAECRALGRAGLRMDTWASNEALIGYYQRLGFRLLGRRRLGRDRRLPPHYHDDEFALLERPSVELVRPTAEHLPSYVSALERGWSPDNLRPETARDELARIARDAERFLAEQEDRDASGPPIVLPDGSTVQRLPGIRRWMWDGEFCGVVGFRWQRGTTALPPTCLGHIGYSVAPWKRGRGYATRALALILPEAKREGLPYVELTTDPTNVPSQRVIEANGGVLVEEFIKPASLGGTPGLRYRIALDRPT